MSTEHLEGRGGDEEEECTPKSKMMKPSVAATTDGGNDDEHDLIEQLFNEVKNTVGCSEEASATEDNSGIDDGYITIEQFNKTRLNVVQDTLIPTIKANIENFNKYLDTKLNHTLFSDLLKSVEVAEHYNVLYSMLIEYFIDNSLDEGTLVLLLIVLKGILIFKGSLMNSSFETRINSIIKTTTTFNISKAKCSASAYLSRIFKLPPAAAAAASGDQQQPATKQSSNYHFEKFPQLYEILVGVLDMCNKITRLATPKTVAFKQITTARTESRQNGNKTFRPARRITLDRPMLVKVTTKIVGDGFCIYTCTDEDSQLIVSKLKSSLYFENEHGQRINPVFFPGVTIGEFQKKMSALRIYEIMQSKAIATVNKESLNSDMFIITDAINIVYNDNPDKFGISAKCWPLKLNYDDNFSNAQFCIVDFTCDKELLKFLDA